MYLLQVFSFITLLSAIAVNPTVAEEGPAGRLLYGQAVDNGRQFPHHVYIVVVDSGRRCGGSILNNRWILTSASCVKDGIRLDLYFRKMEQYSIRGDFFSISVNRDQVFIYPTNYDDIALVKVPTMLVFSESLAPLNISALPIEALRDRFTVMPGFRDFIEVPTPPTESPGYETTTTMTTLDIPHPPSPADPDVPLPDTPAPTPPVVEVTPPSVIGWHLDNMGSMDEMLRYGMFNVIDNRICKRELGSNFDEYTQLCVDSWGDNPNRPCDSDYGSGLIVGWPAKSELVGLFSMFSPGCNTNKPAVFTFIGKYMGWIQGMMRG